MIGANDTQDFLGPPDVPYTSPQWNTMYAQRVAKFMQIAETGGAAVVWVGMPPMQNPGLSAQMSDVNAVVQQQAALAHPAVTFSAPTRPWAHRRAATRPSSPTGPARSSTSVRPTART